jgi:hypothetical protein
MNNHSIIQHGLIVIAFSVVLAEGVVQSAQAADSNWFLGQLQQTDGYTPEPSAAALKMTDGNTFRTNTTPATGANGYVCASAYSAYMRLNGPSDDIPGQDGSESSCGAERYIFSPNDINIAEYEAYRRSAEKWE